MNKCVGVDYANQYVSYTYLFNSERERNAFLAETGINGFSHACVTSFEDMMRTWKIDPDVVFIDWGNRNPSLVGCNTSDFESSDFCYPTEVLEAKEVPHT